MPRLLVLCWRPHHLSREEAEGWLSRELEEVLRRDEMDSVTVSRVASPPGQWAGSFDWLIEFRFGGPASTVLEPAGACTELLADLRLLGMAPTVALAEDDAAIERRRS